eukprot:IDg4090t1
MDESLPNTRTVAVDSGLRKSITSPLNSVFCPKGLNYDFKAPICTPQVEHPPRSIQGHQKRKSAADFCAQPAYPSRLRASPEQTSFGLLPGKSLEEYRTNPVCHLSYFNYMLEARDGRTKDTQQQLLTVLDTGAGPNLIRSALLSEESLRPLENHKEVVNLSSASKHRLDVMGTLPLTVTVAEVTIRQRFVVVR